MYTTECPRCGKRIGPHDLYCSSCSRELGRPSNQLEKRRSLHLVYTVILVLINAGVLLYLFWRSYM